MVFKVKSRFGYDDSLDAFGVHGAGGTLGALLTGVFAVSGNQPGIRRQRFGHARPDGRIDGHWAQLVQPGRRRGDRLGNLGGGHADPAVHRR